MQNAKTDGKLIQSFPHSATLPHSETHGQESPVVACLLTAYIFLEEGERETKGELMRAQLVYSTHSTANLHR